MNVQDYTGEPEGVLDAAFSLAKLHPKKAPTIEIAMRVVGETVAKVAQARIAHEIYVDLMDEIAAYEVINGDYSDVDGADETARSDYESGMDDVVEKALEPYDALLSANWLGLNTVDTGVWNSTISDRTIVEKLAASAAKEVYKQLTFEKTPAQVLASAGILKTDIEARLAAQTEPKGETDVTDIQDVVAKVKTHIGKGFDPLAVADDLDMIVDGSDEHLTGSAASRLGMSAADVEALQIAAFSMTDPVDEMITKIHLYKPPSGRSVKKAEKQAKEAQREQDEADGIATVVFEALKECGVKDTPMADALGVSRSTYNNYVKGKTHLVADEEQYKLLRGEVVERANMLLGALAALDGTELQQVA